MSEQIGIGTVGGLLAKLKNYPPTMIIAMFDTQIGFTTVAFKRESQINGDKSYSWLTFY